MTDKIAHSIRVPPELWRRLCARAKSDRRSANSELLWMIERGLDEPIRDRARCTAADTNA